MKSLRLTATPIESHSRMSMPSGFDADTVHVMVVGATNTGKTIILAMIREKLRDLGVDDCNFRIDSCDLENSELPYDKMLQDPLIRSCILSKRYALHEVQASRPMSLDRFDDLDRFKELVDRMSTEWIEKKGDVTCEFSTSSRYLDEKHRYLHSKAKEGVVWKIEYCDTCEKHHPGLNYHVEIVS